MCNNYVNLKAVSLRATHLVLLKKKTILPETLASERLYQG